MSSETKELSAITETTMKQFLFINDLRRRIRPRKRNGTCTANLNTTRVCFAAAILPKARAKASQIPYRARVQKQDHHVGLWSSPNSGAADMGLLTRPEDGGDPFLHSVS